MTRLLLVSTVSSFVRAFLLPYAAYFRSKGWQVDAMASGISNCVDCTNAFDRVWEAQWSRNPVHPANMLHASRTIKQAAGQGKYDIIHVHTPVAGLVSRFALRSSPHAVKVYTAHGFHFHDKGQLLKNMVFLTLERLAARWTDYLIVINQPDAASALKYHLVPESTLVQMPGIGLDTQKRYNANTVSEAEVSECKRRLAIQSTDPVFLMVAEFQPNKRHRDAIHALARLRFPRAHLIFAGEGPTLTAIKRLAVSLGLDARVHFLGVRNDIPTLIRSASATLLCSEREGLPRSVMESLSLGIPVIGTNIRGTQELLGGGAGHLYPVGDIERLGCAMSSILTHPAEAAAMARVGREKIAAYDITRVLSMHEHLYSTALRHRRSAMASGVRHHTASAVQ